MINEIESYVLGSAILTKSVSQIIDIVSPECFTTETNKAIYSAMIELHNDGSEIDYMLLIKKLKYNEVKVSPATIVQITDLMQSKSANPSNIKHYAFILLQEYLKDNVRITLQDLCLKIDSGIDFFEAYKSLVEKITWVESKLNEQVVESNLSEQINETIKEIEAARGGLIVGISSGSRKLDAEIGGFHRKNLIVMVGRPGSGKTSRALSFALSALKNGKKVCVFSVEMGYSELIKKILSNKTEINSQELSNGKITDNDLKMINSAAAELKNNNLYIYDKAGINTSYIRRIATAKQPDIIIIDYLQIVKADQIKGRNREQEVASISIELKIIAKELNIPVIVLSQLSRSCEQRTNKRPMMSDIRESGQIEQDADLILGLFRPVYYDQYDDREDEYKTYYPEQYEIASELHILKNRNGRAAICVKEEFIASKSTYRETN